MAVIETRGLSYAFSRGRNVVSDINLLVPEGSIYGFLGPNGAGKTTTLKILLGLLKCQDGEVRIFEKDFSRHRIGILKRTGSLIESPSLYGQLTARENLEVLRKVSGVPSSAINDALRLVGLEQTGKKRAGAFSLGMKQRLGVAMAMLHRPELLVLDEPTNGLDPAGIVEMRDMLLALNRERGVTILISSHLLSEIQKLVSHVGVIMNGRLAYQGMLAELLEKRRQSGTVFVEASDTIRAGEILSTYLPGLRVHQQRIEFLGDRELVARVNRDLVNNGIDVYSIGQENNSLEEVFMELTAAGI